ncbi:unnamed protein product [Calypogeia fissa]
MGSVDRVKPNSLFSGMDRHELRSCRSPLGVVVLFVVLWLCCVPAYGLQPARNDGRSSLWSITDFLQLGRDGESSVSSSSATDSFKLNERDQSSPLWELPITTGPDCDVSALKDRGGGVRTGSACDDDSITAASNAGGVPQKEETVEEKQVLVACNVKCFRADPVCGEDAVTYWCGDAEAKCAGVEVAYKGYCDSRSGGAGKDGTRAAQSLFLVHLLWLVLAGFLVIADLL